MSVLIAYATHSGATKSLAETIASALAESGTAAEAIDVGTEPDPLLFDAVVLGSGVRVDAFEKPALAWASRHGDALARRPVAVFSCSGSAADPAKQGRQKATEKFLAEAPFAPVSVRDFPGWVLMDRIPLHERVLLKSMRTPTGDFRDLEAVAGWAEEIRPLLSP